MKKQKIGIDIRAIGQQRAGDERYTLNLVKALLKIDDKNQYFLLTDTAETSDIKKKIFSESKTKNKAGIKNKNVKIISILPKIKLFWTFLLLSRMAKRLDLDVLHVQYIAPFWLPKKTKLITTVADISFKFFPEFINKMDLFFLNTLIPLSLKRADKIIAVSNFTKKEIINKYKTDPNKIVAIHNGDADENFFKKTADEKKLLRKFNIKKPYLFYIGTHQPRKDIPTLIEAFLEIKAEHSQKPEIKNLQLIIGGKIKAHNYDPKIDKIIKKAQKNPQQKSALKDLLFIGYIKNEELPTLYRQAEIFVSPSLYEGFGFPLIEAAISKTPVISSDIECSQEVAGNSAKFYQAHDKRDLQKAILEVIMEPGVRKDLIKKGVKNATKYSWKKTARETLETFVS